MTREELVARVGVLESEVASLIAVNDKLQAENTKLKDRILKIGGGGTAGNAPDGPYVVEPSPSFTD